MYFLIQFYLINFFTKVLKVDCPPELMTQLNVYMEESEADSTDATSVYEQKGFDLRFCFHFSS